MFGSVRPKKLTLLDGSGSNNIFSPISGVFTGAMMCNFRSTEAWKLNADGWVGQIQSLNTDKNVTLFKVEVTPSMKINEKPHIPWVAADSDGKILTAHCICKAGYVCYQSHIYSK